MSVRRREDELGNIGTELLFENERIRVWDLVLEPGEACPMHRHLHDFVWVDVTPSRKELIGPFPPTTFDHAQGFVQYNVVGRGGRDFEAAIRNIGTETQRQIVVEFLGESASEVPLPAETNGRGGVSPNSLGEQGDGRVITYVNGEYVPHDEAKISVDDRGIMFGDSVFDIARTFGGVGFRLDEHLERLRRSMRYVELDGDALLPSIRDATHEVLARNADEIEAVGDVLVEQIVTRGTISAAGADSNAVRPTVIVKLRPLYFSSFAPFYRTGVDLHSSLLTTPFAGPMDPRVKAANRLANTRAELKGERMRPRGRGHWTVIFNPDGSISETHSANLLALVDGVLLVPPVHEALGGVSLMTTIELARGLGLEVRERRLMVYDVINADETLMTATSFCLLPVVGLDGIPLRAGRELYGRLQRAWIDLVGLDFVAQAEAWTARGAAAPAATAAYS